MRNRTAARPTGRFGAQAGVPFIRFFGDFFPKYPEPTDTADALDPARVQRVA